VFASHHFNRAANRRIPENRRTLLRELDEENLTDVRASSKTFLIIVNAAQSGIDRCVVKLNTDRKIHFQLDASGCFLGRGAPKRDNRFGNKLPLLRFARQVGNVPLAALLGLETVAPDIARPVRSKGR
jgi:hypothetical protein